MGRPALTIPLLFALGLLAAGSVSYGVVKARNDSADLERRAEEIELFLKQSNPYNDLGHDNTYPPSALPVFAAIVPTGTTTLRRMLWVGLNMTALYAICGLFVGVWGRDWPPWLKAAFCLAAAASKPARAGIALGQFHLIPTALLLGAEAAVCSQRPVVAGVLAGLAMIKPTMAAPYGALLVVRRQWLTLGVALGLQAILFAGASAWLGLGPSVLIRGWLANARSQLAMGTIDVSSLMSNVTGGIGVNASTASVFVLLLSAALLGILRRRSSLGLTALALFSAAVMTYHRHYDMVLLLPTLAYFIDAYARKSWRGAGWVSLAFGVILIAPSHASIAPIPERVHDLVFVVSAYLALALLIVTVAMERPPKTPTTSPPPGGDDRGR